MRAAVAAWWANFALVRTGVYYAKAFRHKSVIMGPAPRAQWGSARVVVRWPTAALPRRRAHAWDVWLQEHVSTRRSAAAGRYHMAVLTSTPHVLLPSYLALERPHLIAERITGDITIIG
jgi:hypothetical protein